jgi:hypothetical protein
MSEVLNKSRLLWPKIALFSKGSFSIRSPPLYPIELRARVFQVYLTMDWT